MARNRIIKKEFYTDQKIIELEIPERLLFIGMTNFSDDTGIHINSAKMLKCEIFPADDIKVSYIEKSLLKMADLGLIDFNEDRSLIRIRNWSVHQKINRPYPSKYEFVEGFSEHSVNTHGTISEDSSPNNNKKENKNKKKNNNIEKRKQKFTNQTLAEGLKHTPMIDPRICDEFIDYWTEMNKSKTKMKFEMQETFDISRRLKRWINNDFSNNSSGESSMFQLDSTGNAYIGYCSKCCKSGFYRKDELNHDSKCCNDKVLPKRNMDQIQDINAKA